MNTIKYSVPKQKQAAKSVSGGQQILKQLEILNIPKEKKETFLKDLTNKDNLSQIICIDCQFDHALLRAKDSQVNKSVKILVRIEERVDEILSLFQKIQEISLKNKDNFVEIVDVWSYDNLVLVEEEDLFTEDLEDWLEVRGDTLSNDEKIKQVESILNCLQIMEENNILHKNLNFQSFLISKKLPILSLRTCQLAHRKEEEKQKKNMKNPKNQLISDLPDACAIGIIISIIDNWKKFENSKLKEIDVSKIKSALLNQGSLSLDLLEIDITSLLFPIHSDLIRNGLLENIHQINSTVTNCKLLLEQAKLKSADIPKEDAKEIKMDDPYSVVSQNMNSVSGGIKKQDSASGAILSQIDQEKQDPGLLVSQEKINRFQRDQNKPRAKNSIIINGLKGNSTKKEETIPLDKLDDQIEDENSQKKLNKKQEQRDGDISYDHQIIIQFEQELPNMQILQAQQSLSRSIDHKNDDYGVTKYIIESKEEKGQLQEEDFTSEINKSQAKQNTAFIQFQFNNKVMNRAEIMQEYKNYLLQLKINCTRYEEIRMKIEVETGNWWLYKISCVEPIEYIKLVLVGMNNSLVGKNVMMLILVPFIKVFNKPWIFKNQKNLLINIFGHPLLWIIKILNILFMIVLISIYFCFLIVFLVIVYIIYFILRTFIFGLIPFGLVRLTDRLGNHLYDLKSGILYGRQLSFTWYALDPKYQSAKEFFNFHMHVISYKKKPIVEYSPSKLISLNESLKQSA